MSIYTDAGYENKQDFVDQMVSNYDADPRDVNRIIKELGRVQDISELELAIEEYMEQFNEDSDEDEEEEMWDEEEE